MKRPILSPLAQKDLRSIWLYSAENWGRKQTDRYAGSIRQDMQDLRRGRKSVVLTMFCDRGTLGD